jgi:hypothetical protein
MAEYLSDDSTFNVGARIAITNELKVDGALIDGEDWAFGISYTKIGLD